MDYLEKIKSFAIGAADTIGQKSKEVYGVAKLKLEITDKQGKVKDLYKQIGYDAYKAYRGKADILEQISPMFSQIDAFEEEIVSLRKKVEDIKGNSDDEEGSEAIDAEIVSDEQAEYDEAETEPVDFE